MKSLLLFAVTWTLIASYNGETELHRALSQKQDEETTACGPITCKELCSCGSESKAYLLNLPGVGDTSVYCHMTALGACGVGGWTLVMKIDGTKETFHYDSELWSDKNAHNPTGGQTGLDSQETKLPTYWTTPFSKICLGMKIDGETRFILINEQASSLYSLIADGQYRATSLGRNMWKSLIGPEASLQLNCNKEGFNVFIGGGWPEARIGIVSNEQNDCNTPDSRIGFGTGGSPDDTNTCGNVANGEWSPDNGAKNIKAMGYIFVQ